MKLGTLARTTVIGIALSCVSYLVTSQICLAQLEPASPPIANPADRRFVDVTEDLTSLSLSDSKLKPVRPLVGYINHYHSYSVELLQVQWRFGDPLDLYLIKPDGVKRPPVILYLYSYPDDTDRFKDEGFQQAAIKNGFAAVGFVSALTGQRYHDRPMREWFISELQESLVTSVHDVQMVLTYLDTRNDLDMSRVGMFTQGSGSSIGILASGVDARIKVLDTLDPWGDWPTWMAKSPFVPADERPQYLQPAFLNKVEPLEPANWMKKIQAIKFRLQEQVFEPTTPMQAKEKLWNSVPERASVAIYKTPEDIDKMISGSKELEWIKNELHSLSLPESRQ